MHCWLEQEEGLFVNEEPRSWYNYMYKFISRFKKNKLKSIDVVMAESQPLSFYKHVAFPMLMFVIRKRCVWKYIWF